MFGGGANTNPRQSTRVTHAPGGKSNTAGLFGGDSASRTQQAAQQAQQRRHQATLDANYQHNTPAVSAMTGMTAGTPSQQGNWGTSVGGGQSTVDVFSHAGQGGYDNPYARGHKVGAKGKEAPGGPKTLSSDATAALFGAAAGAKVRAQEEALKEKYKVVSQGTSVGGGVNKPVKRKHSLWRVCAILGSPCFFFSLVYANARFAFVVSSPRPRHDAFSHTGQGMQHNPYDMSHKATGGRTREVPLKKPDAVDQLVQKVDTRACIWGLDPNKKKVPTLVMEKNTWQQPKNARFMHPTVFFVLSFPVISPPTDLSPGAHPHFLLLAARRCSPNPSTDRPNNSGRRPFTRKRPSAVPLLRSPVVVPCRIPSPHGGPPKFQGSDEQTLRFSFCIGRPWAAARATAAA